MAQSNTAKWKIFANGSILYGPAGTGQNLNTDIEKSIADESDAIVTASVGNGVISGLEPSDGGGLNAEIAAGSALISGQRIAQGIASTIALADDTADQKVYLQADTPWSVALKAWPVVLGKTTGSIPADSILLGTFTTVSGSITVVTDGRAIFIEGQEAIAATIDDSTTPADTAQSINRRFGMLAAMLKAITGESTWRTTPDSTVAALFALFNASTGHNHDGSANQGAQISHTDLADLTSGDPHTQYARKVGAQFTGDVSLKKASPAVRWIGTEGSAKDTRIIENGGFLSVQRNDGTEGSPTWVDILRIDLAGLTVTLRNDIPFRMSMGIAGNVVATPSNSGGTLTTNTYYYKIVGVDIGGNLTAPSAEVSAPVTGPNGSVALTWDALPGAASYRIYKGISSGGQDRYFTSSIASYSDTSNGAGTAGTPPATTALAFHTFISSNGDGWIAGQVLGDKRNLHLGHQVRLDTLPAAALVLPNRYAQA